MVKLIVVLSIHLTINYVKLLKQICRDRKHKTFHSNINLFYMNGYLLTKHLSTGSDNNF